VEGRDLCLLHVSFLLLLCTKQVLAIEFFHENQTLNFHFLHQHGPLLVRQLAVLKSINDVCGDADVKLL
jgi:hypothetical protein